MKRLEEIIQAKPWIAWALFFGTIVAVFLLGVFGASIMERRYEARLQFQLVKPIADWEPRNEVWGENFPREFETYHNTKDTTFHSKHGGSAEIDYLSEFPNLVVMWAGYPFSRDYKQGRGHYYAVEDIRNTLRTNSPMPGTCWTCKSTDVPRVMKEKGAEEFYKAPWESLGAEIVNHIGCQDCHDPQTMNLRITRPALQEAFERQGKDITKATHQEMRSLVCAQCHVEYYFKGDGKYLTFPWDSGSSVEAMEKYYDNINFKDWDHKLSKAPMIKAQHPDYEVYLTGTHAERGVACADCHMPYRSEGGVKFTDHKIQSPLNNIANSCAVCHRWSESEIRNKVYSIQDKVLELRMAAEKAITKAHIEAKFAWENNATQEEMGDVLKLIRHAQFRWDYVAASNGLGFHSAGECSRILGSAIQKAQEARVLLARILAKHGITDSVEMPDITTKEKAQVYIGLNMQEELVKKQQAQKDTFPKWDEIARIRQEKYNEAYQQNLRKK